MEPSNPSLIPASTPQDPVAFEKAYQAVLPEIMALAPNELFPINLDIISAVTTVCGVYPELQAIRPEIVKQLPAFDLGAYDRLHDYALAAGYAHTQHLVATTPPDGLRELQEEAVKLRECLLADATALAHRGMINGDALRDLRGAVGYKNIATDLQMLINVLKASWSKIAGKCGTTPVELRRGAELVEQLLQTLGVREQGPATIAETAEVRQRAFTLLHHAYDEARRAIIYLRWREGDADDIAPSLFGGRIRKKEDGKSSEVKKAGPSEDAAAAPTATPPGATPATPPVATQPAQPAKAAPDGPGPFMS